MTLGKKRNWDAYFFSLAYASACMSKDPRTQVGAVIVGPDREVRSVGFNGFPRGVADHEFRLVDRDLKNSLMVHAEMNAVLNAVRHGVRTLNCTLYLLATDDSGAVWGGPPCMRCTIQIIQAGIIEVVSHPFKIGPSNWSEDVRRAGEILREAGVAYREVSVP